MDEGGPTDGTRPSVEWELLPSHAVSAPIVRSLPYLELKLEHPDLDATGHGTRFFPDAVPYELDGTPRVVYWRPALTPSAGEPGTWELTCATTHELAGLETLPAGAPDLVTTDGCGTTLVVDGTVGGDVTTCRVRSYAAPAVTVDRSDALVELTVDGTEYTIPVGDRRRIRLPTRRVDPLDADGEPTSVTPELVARCPGRRELHHPAPGATYRLFPSFDLDLATVPNPLPVPTTAGELDDVALATALDVELSRRPYPERVLWQAFAYTAFDPHADVTPELTQLESGHIVLLNGNESQD